jgi:hypothetical protein
MNKIFLEILVFMFVIWLYSFAGLDNQSKYLETENAQAAASTTSTVTLSGTVTTYLNLTWWVGQSISFATITPGTDSCSDAPSWLGVITNAANGYTVSLSDGSNTNSSMRHTDTTTYIPDMLTGSFAAPIPWVTGITTGLGVTMFSADTNKESGWGTGTNDCSTNKANSYFNKFSAVPSAATVAHTAAGYKAADDGSKWDWKVNVVNSQKTGIYSGSVTFTVTAVFS